MKIQKQGKKLGREVDVFPAMDVTVYPPPPQPLAAPDHNRLGQISYPDPAFGTNKVSGGERKQTTAHRLLLLADKIHFCVVLF